MRRPSSSSRPPIWRPRRFRRLHINPTDDLPALWKPPTAAARPIVSPVISPSPPLGAERVGVRWGSIARAATQPTLTSCVRQVQQIGHDKRAQLNSGHEDIPLFDRYTAIPSSRPAVWQSTAAAAVKDAAARRPVDDTSKATNYHGRALSFIILEGTNHIAQKRGTYQNGCYRPSYRDASC